MTLLILAGVTFRYAISQFLDSDGTSGSLNKVSKSQRLECAIEYSEILLVTYVSSVKTRVLDFGHYCTESYFRCVTPESNRDNDWKPMFLPT